MLRLQFVKEKETYDVDFSRISDNIVQLIGVFPPKTKGFYLSRPDFDDNWNYTKFTTVYRQIPGGYQFSSDGSVYVEPKVTKTISALWEDGNDFDQIRPDSVKVTAILDGISKVLVLKKEEGYQKSYKNVPESKEYKIKDALDVEGYSKNIVGPSVIFHHDYVDPDPEPTLEERVTNAETDIGEVELSVEETFENTMVNAEGIENLELAVQELYELLLGDNEEE